MSVPGLCTEEEGCLLLAGHAGRHDHRPKHVWAFFGERDVNKINKAGYATPRGGAKGAYQNHVYRNNRVIVPYERLGAVDLSRYEHRWVLRLFPEQYFDAPGTPKPEFGEAGAPRVGTDAFVLYRSHRSLRQLPPPREWEVRWLFRDGRRVDRRSARAVDRGEYVLRLPEAGAGRPARSEGPAQGIFAPEYAPARVNYQCQAMLAWLTVHSRSSPYTTSQVRHLEAVLERCGLLGERLEQAGITRNGLTTCPLCLKVIDYSELHAPVDFADIAGLLNAGLQVRDATRSTKANLFHLEPLVYETLNHRPTSVAWGHAICNTLLGQRHCHSLAELQRTGRELGTTGPGGSRTIGRISADDRMIRSPGGGVWVQVSADMSPQEREASFDRAQDHRSAPAPPLAEP